MSEQIQKLIEQFFPALIYSESELAETLAKGEILTAAAQILPYLQTALLDEKILEVELDGGEHVYFSRLKDDLPNLIQDEVDGELVSMEPDYEEGRYLTSLSHLISLPLEPGMGNLHLRNSRSILLRMFTKSFAVEFGTVFSTTTKVREIPVLRLAYPSIARIVHQAREFRAKVIDNLDLTADIEIDEDEPPLTCRPADISLKGMALSLSKAEHAIFTLHKSYSIKLFIEDELLARLDGTIRHKARVRKRARIEYLCGIEFSLPYRTTAAAVESIVTTVQRAHLKELAEKSHAIGIDLIN